MRYAGLLENDFINGEDVCVSVWMQGCPFHCPQCHNPQTWDFNGGEEIELEVLIKKILSAIKANGIQRNFSVLGGEPLCRENWDNTLKILKAVREAYPTIKIFLWTGNTFEELIKGNSFDELMELTSLVDTLIDGRFEIDKRDVGLPLRGSSNQRIIKLHHD